MLLKTYIILCGITLICAGILGFYSSFGTRLETEIVGEYWYMDVYQSLFHLILGLFTFYVGVGLRSGMQKTLAWIFSLLSMALAAYSLYNDQLFQLIGLEKPGDTLFYLVLGSVGLMVLTIVTISERSQELEELRRKLKV